jgi:hypothetical protein
VPVAARAQESELLLRDRGDEHAPAIEWPSPRVDFPSCVQSSLKRATGHEREERSIDERLGYVPVEVGCLAA